MARRALLIGVSEYGEGFESLPGSLLDVRGMAAALGDPQQGAFEAPIALENPERLAMEAATGQFFQGAGAGDLLLFYFSGHGDLGISVAQQQLHFCVKGSRKEQKRLQEWTAMSAETLKRQMSLSKAGQIVVILDCCYSGAIADLLRKGEGENALEALKAPGRVILASSSAAQSSFQAVDGLSLYTHYLLEGMAGAALPQDGRGERAGDWIVARDLHGYAERRFEVEQKGGVSPKIIVARDAGYEIPIVRAPRLDPVLEYRREVDRIFQELDGELGLAFDGEISDPLDRGFLETLRVRLEVPLEVAQQLEQKVQAPYGVRARQRAKYREYFGQAVGDGCLPSERSRRRLEGIRQNLQLGKADAERIEQAMIQERQLQPRSAPKSPQPEPQPSPPGSRTSPTPRTDEQPFVPPSAPANGPKLIRFDFKTVQVDERGQITQREARSAEQFIEDLGNSITLEMVDIPGGEFWMGAADGEEEALSSEYPHHRVQVPEFCVGKYALTQAQYEAVMGENPSNFKGENRPVEQVSWNDAQEFCKKLSERTGREYRLPSEAEWEYACRAGTTTPFYFGETITPDLVNYDGNYTYGKSSKGKYREQTTEVGSFPPNAFGLYDMHGNVWEWCADKWHDNYEKAPTDGSTWITFDDSKELHILRGGSWNFNPRNCRSAQRVGNVPDDFNFFTGFRVVCAALRT